MFRVFDKLFILNNAVEASLAVFNITRMDNKQIKDKFEVSNHCLIYMGVNIGKEL